MAILLNYPWVNAFVKYFDYDKLSLLACSVCLSLENFTKKLEKKTPKKQRYIMFKIPLTEINAILIMWHQAIYWEWKCLEKVCNSFKYCSCLFFFKGWNCFLCRKQNYAYLFLMSGSNKDKFYINNCHLKTWNEIGMPIHWMKHVI